MRVLPSALAVLLGSALSFSAFAGCALSGTSYLCTTRGEAQTAANGWTGSFNCATHIGPRSTARYKVVGPTSSVFYAYQTCTSEADGTYGFPPNYDHQEFSYSGTCSTAQDFLNYSESSTSSSNDIPQSGSAQCYQGCVYTWSTTSAARYNMPTQTWNQSGTLTHTGAACPTTDPPPAPKQNDENNTLPDADRDGIPDSADPYPNDPSNTPPPPPPDRTPVAPPTTGASTNAGLNALGIALGNQLNAIAAAIGGLTANINSNAAAAAAGQAQGTGAVVGAIGGISGGSGSGSATDMGPTNAILSGIHSDTTNLSDSLKATGTAPSTDSGLLSTPGDAAQDVGSDDSGSDLNSTGFGWSRSCPVIPDIVVFDQTLTIDMSPVCTVGGALGTLLVMLSLLAGARIATSET